MYDLHAHILPGLDDGPEGWDTAIEMLRLAGREGIRGIAATPHVSPVYSNTSGAVLALTEELKRRSGGIGVEVYPGSEITLAPESLAGIREKRYCTLNNSRYVLIELPGHFIPQAIHDFIFALTSAGFVPIVAHPERNPRAQSDVEALSEMVRLGALMQVTAGSITGFFGSRARKTAREMFARRISHIIASDAHDAGSRPPLLLAAFREAARIAGEPEAKSMVDEVPGKILKDQPFEACEPVHVKKRMFFF